MDLSASQRWRVDAEGRWSSSYGRPVENRERKVIDTRVLRCVAVKILQHGILPLCQRRAGPHIQGRRKQNKLDARGRHGQCKGNNITGTKGADGISHGLITAAG